MRSEINAVILAGGLGSRMGSLTLDRSKSMLEVEGKPVLSHIFDGLQSEFGSAKVILTTGYQGERIKEEYGERYGNIEINYVHDPSHLEVRRRLLLADGLLDGPFFVIGSDVIVNPDQYKRMAQTYETYSPENIFGVISGAADLQPAPTHALISTEGNKVIEIQTYSLPTILKPSVYRDMSLWYFDQKTLYLLKNAPDSELNISPVLNEAIKHGADYLIEKYYDRWYHFGTPKDLEDHLEFLGNGPRQYAYTK